MREPQEIVKMGAPRPYEQHARYDRTGCDRRCMLQARSVEGTSMDEHGETADGASSALNRRRLLKGAAAAGIGVAVWTTPSIKSIGGTPAYAAVCTSGSQNYALGSRNTSCNCGQAPNK